MITSLERKLVKYQRNLSTQRRRKGRQRIAVKERQKKARSDVMSRSSSSTSSLDSSDWKKSAQVHCCRKIEALVFLLANLMIVRQGMFFNYEKRRHARKCVIWPILGTSFSTNRHIFFVPIQRLVKCGPYFGPKEHLFKKKIPLVPMEHLRCIHFRGHRHQCRLKFWGLRKILKKCNLNLWRTCWRAR